MTLPKIDDYVMANHSLDGPFAEDTIKAAPNQGAVVSSVKDTAKGMATAAAAGLLTSELDPDATGQKKLLETAATNVALDTSAAGGVAVLTGAPVAATVNYVAAEAALPTVVAYEAGDAVYNVMDKATSHMDNRPAAGAIKGGLTGAAAVTSATATNVVISAGVNAVKAAQTGAALQQTANSLEGGIEMGEVGEGAGAAAEGAEAATALDAGIEMGAVGAEGAVEAGI